MNKFFTFFLFLTLGFTSLQAQLETDYVKFYDDGFIDTIGRGEDLILLSSGDFAIASRQNQNGSVNYSMNVDMVNIQGEVVASAAIDELGTANSRGKLSEAPDGSIWLLYSYIPDDGSFDERTRVVQLSSNLDTIKSDANFNFFPGLENTYGILATTDQVLFMMRGLVRDEDTGFLRNTYSLIDVDPTSLSVDQRAENIFPIGSSVFNGGVNILQIEADRVGLALISRDSNNVAVDMLIREFALSDLSQVDAYQTIGLGGSNVTLDLVYIPNLDAYVTTGSNFETFLIKRGTGSNPTRDTILAPAGLRADRSRTSISYLDSTLYLFGANAYQIDFANDTVSQVSEIAGYPRNFSYRLREVDSSGNILLASTSANATQGLRLITLIDSTSMLTDTLDLTPPVLGGGVSQYSGAFTFPSLLDTTPPILGIGQRGTVGESLLTVGYEIVDANTGELTGQTVSTNDISFFANNEFFDPTLAPLVSIGDGYMGLVNERNSITFWRYDDSLRVGQPDSVGFGRAFPFDVNLSNATTVPTSYGILGMTIGSPSGDFNNYYPYIFAGDTSFITRIETRVDTLSYSAFGELSLSIDSLDRFYSAGAAAPAGDPFGRNDTINVIGHEADGSIRFITQVGLFGAPFYDVGALDLNNEQTELLLSGTYRDTTTNLNFGYLARIDAADGSVLELTSYSPLALGYGPVSGVSVHRALYDANDNPVLALSIFDQNESLVSTYDLRAIQLDSAGGIIANNLVYQSVGTFVGLDNFTKIGEALFLSGSTRTLSGLQDVFYIAKVNTGTLVNTKEVPKNVTEALQLTAFPNPVNDQVSLTWEQPKASDYSLQLFDMTGRSLKRWIGNQGAGTAQIEVPMADLPKGPYFIRLDVADGYMVRTIIKQ